MQNLQFVQSFQASNYLNYDLPDVLLLHELFVVLTLANTLKDVAVISKFHHDAILYNYGSQGKIFDKNESSLLTKENWMAHQRMPPCMMQRMDFWSKLGYEPHWVHSLFPYLIGFESWLSWGRKAGSLPIAWPCKRLSRIHRLHKYKIHSTVR